MPLPSGDGRENVPWPPMDTRPAFDTINSWSAWYSGDPDQLERVYQLRDQRLTTSGLQIRPSQYRGGIIGWLARTFWGAPPSVAEPRTKLHVPLATDISQVSSDLLFSEPITITHDDKQTQEQLTKLLNDTLHVQLIESAEVCSGLGGVYLRAVWDKDVDPDRPWISGIHADAAVPDWNYGRLQAVTFWRELKRDGNVVIRHLERHEKGVIYHAVYEGSPEMLGRKASLGSFPETKDIPVDTDGAIDTGIELLTAVYMPNIKPNRLWRNQPANCHLGRSDYSGIEGVMDALDETWSSLLRDIRLGKGRVFVPSVYLESQQPGQGAFFDPNREIYEQLNMLPDGSSTQLTVAQFEIRVEEHMTTADRLVRQAIGTAGYSPQSFGLEGDVAVTATEVSARYRKSLGTRDKKILYARPPIQEILRVEAELGRVHFGWPTSGEKTPDVIFPDAVQPDPEQNARTIQLLDAARAASIETKVIMANPDRKDDTEWIKNEVGKIMEENQIGPKFEQPDTFRGDAGQPGTKQQSGQDKPPTNPNGNQ